MYINFLDIKDFINIKKGRCINILRCLQLVEMVKIEIKFQKYLLVKER